MQAVPFLYRVILLDIIGGNSSKKKIATICGKSLGSIFYFLVRLCCRHNSSETAVSKLSFTKALNVKKYLQKRSLSWYNFDVCKGSVFLLHIVSVTASELFCFKFYRIVGHSMIILNSHKIIKGFT